MGSFPIFLVRPGNFFVVYSSLKDKQSRLERRDILFFLIAPALCGAAQNLDKLIVCRAVHGIRGEGALQLVQITISDIVSLEEYVESSYSVIISITAFPGYFCDSSPTTPNPVG